MNLHFFWTTFVCPKRWTHAPSKDIPNMFLFFKRQKYPLNPRSSSSLHKCPLTANAFAIAKLKTICSTTVERACSILHLVMNMYVGSIEILFYQLSEHARPVHALWLQICQTNDNGEYHFYLREKWQFSLVSCLKFNVGFTSRENDSKL